MAGILAHLAAYGAHQRGRRHFGLPAVPEDFTAPGPDAPTGACRPGCTALQPDRGACRHPDGAARPTASAPRDFADDIDQHLTRGVCAAVHRQRRTPVPSPEPPENRR
ncbi:MAG: hypothetical protein JF597_50300 [Streptomyces sp.]|uniref:hypothetical protein n=1 Tax=Streptomyces sp. TaxID=1931 RepID=UPI0025F8CF4B|nr:hypothetical protein [Streptomyces sp.]MBW8801449.1 hypothetical protein [Streptomyces sp.]